MRLFCKTWQKDFQWLKVAMISVQKMCDSQTHWTIVIDDGTRGELDKVLAQVSQISGKHLGVNVYETSSHWADAMKIQNGYIRQQWIKMTAHRVMESGYFWNWDSDVIAQKRFSIENFMGYGGRPIHWITQINALMGAGNDKAHTVRKNLLHEVFGSTDVAFEYMRCMPMPMMTEVLKQASSTAYWEKSYELACRNDERFSEFNIIGYFSHLYFLDVYDWRNTQNYDHTFAGEWGNPKCIIAQGWSWGGCPQDVYDAVVK